MRKLTSFLFISVDGVVEAPNRFVRDDAYGDLTPIIAETIAEQDSVLLGRRMYEEWSQYWPAATIEPFATFINTAPKFVMSRTLKTLAWGPAAILSGDLRAEIGRLKDQPGKAIGVHGSLSLVQSLLVAGLIDELRFVVAPVVAGEGRRLLSRDGDPLQLNLQSVHTTASGLQYVVYTPL